MLSFCQSQPNEFVLCGHHTHVQDLCWVFGNPLGKIVADFVQAIMSSPMLDICMMKVFVLKVFAH